jgi:hypothetical protein
MKTAITPTGHLHHSAVSLPFLLHGHSSPARRVNSHSRQSTENPAGRSPRRDFSRTSIAGHRRSAKLKISSPNQPSRAYKRARPAPHLVPHLHDQFPLLPELSIATTSAARAVLGCRPPAAIDLPPQFVPDQGEERNELPSTSSSFCPTSRPPPWPGSPVPLPPSPVDLPVRPVLYREGGRKKMVVLPIPPCPFSTSPKSTPPLFSHSFLSKQTLCFKLNHKNNPVPLQLCP